MCYFLYWSVLTPKPVPFTSLLGVFILCNKNQLGKDSWRKHQVLNKVSYTGFFRNSSMLHWLNIYNKYSVIVCLQVSLVERYILLAFSWINFWVFCSLDTLKGYLLMLYFRRNFLVITFLRNQKWETKKILSSNLIWKNNGRVKFYMIKFHSSLKH